MVGNFPDGLGGFFVQEEDGEADGDPATSDGIFVYSPSSSAGLGDIVRVTGTVAEFYGLTELTSVSALDICDDPTGDATATPAVVRLPLQNEPGTELEPVEGMAIDLAAAEGDLSLAEYFNLDRYGEIRVASGGRPIQFTVENAPDPAAYAAHLVDLERRTRRARSQPAYPQDQGRMQERRMAVVVSVRWVVLQEPG